MAHVEVLYFEGCPHAEGAFELVERVAAKDGATIRAEGVLIESVEDAERHRFIGSPTIRVNGVDVEPDASGRVDFAVACRLYDTPTGKQGLPPEGVFRAALGRAG